MNTSLEIGQIVNTHGLRGEVKVMPWCDDPALFDELAYVCIDNKEFDIERSRMQKNMADTGAWTSVRGMDVPAGH